MLHELIKTWFHWVDQWGYMGIFILMAMESSIIPVPSEIVMPPAAYWASQGRLDFWGVVAAGTFGSYAGSILSYYVSQWVGLPLVRRYGKYVMISPKNIKLGEDWVKQYGVAGVFAARLLPVIRHLISIPAGIFRMSAGRFSAATLAGAGLWCLVLSWFGQQVLGDQPELLNSPENMIHAVKAKLIWFIAAVVILGGLYAFVIRFQKVPPSRRRLKTKKA